MLKAERASVALSHCENSWPAARTAVSIFEEIFPWEGGGAVVFRRKEKEECGKGRANEFS